MNKEEKLNKIIDLLTGKISVEDITEKTFTTKIGFAQDNIYLINNIRVQKEEFDRKTNSQIFTRYSIVFDD